ncbi:MAG: 30S ribosomal protein S14 [Methanobacteriota archaeon]|nr:MAG: 30S ribosomal protein S14 [Euryarchaeota archaeon]
MAKNEEEVKRLKSLSSKKGKGNRKCSRCGTVKGLIRKYDLNLCRRCFREVGEAIGFWKER